VTHGDPYRLDMSPYIGSILAGIDFAIQPSIRVVDKGGNIVESITSNHVTVTLNKKIEGGNLYSSTNFVSYFENGVATFSGMKIDKVGYPYQLRFETEMVYPSLY
jgi:hypothetical protein